MGAVEGSMWYEKKKKKHSRNFVYPFLFKFLLQFPFFFCCNYLPKNGRRETRIESLYKENPKK
jgi:hypothetical protein